MLIVIDAISGSVSNNFSHGHQPVRTSAVVDENGQLLSDLDAVIAHWCRHSTKVLNNASDFSSLGIDRMPLREVRRDLDDFPTYF